MTAGLLSLSTLVGCSKSEGGPVSPVPNPIVSRASLVPTNSTDYTEMRTSQLAPTGPGGQVFDDFTFTGASTIRTVAWQGVYCAQTAGAPAPTPTATAFTLTFHADSSGRPRLGAVLLSSSHTAAVVSQILDRTTSNLPCGPFAGTTWAMYRYQVTLSIPFAAAANTKYWLSVTSATPSYSVLWEWRSGMPDNNMSLQRINSAYDVANLDRAFSLTP